MQELSWAEWDSKSKYRCLHYKFDEQLQWLKDFYVDKLDRLNAFVAEEKEKYAEIRKIVNIQDSELDGLLDIAFVNSKIARILDKYYTTLKEIEGRKLGHFTDRNPVGTIYYIDLNTGNDANDGLSTGQAWLTLDKYIGITSRSPGDIAKVRANTTETVSVTNGMDEDGNAGNPIEVRGCSVADDPWSDSSDVKPIWDFNSGVYQFTGQNDNFWKLNRCVFKNSTDGLGAIRILTSYGWYLLDCEFIDNNTGLYLRESSATLLEGCIFSGNSGSCVYIYYSSVRLNSCILDGDAGSGSGLYVRYSGYVECVDTDFGQTLAFAAGNEIFIVNPPARVITRNCKFGTAGNTISNLGGAIYEEDADGTFEAQLITFKNGTVTRDTGVTRVGGADSSAKMEPSGNNCGIQYPLTFNGNSLIDSGFKVWCPASVTTITIYIRSLGAWSTYPIASELYIQAKYLDHATNATRTKVVSNDVLSDETTWVAFDVTFTPLQAGWAYLDICLAKYEASKGCYVDIKPVVS